MDSTADILDHCGLSSTPVLVERELYPYEQEALDAVGNAGEAGLAFSHHPDSPPFGPTRYVALAWLLRRGLVAICEPRTRFQEHRVHLTAAGLELWIAPELPCTFDDGEDGAP